ncbi:MAG: hypothetical protein IT508_07645 [Burkholderiaceae bacterium]|nr:hypothetical protein [Burkholderiaceae bacterium]
MSDDHVDGDGTAWQPVPGGARGTWSSTVPTDRADQPYRLAKWKGDPGIYDRPTGMPWSETFVVYRGRGTVRFSRGSIDLHPGVVVNLDRGEPYVLTIGETLEKFAVITTRPPQA